LVSFSTDKGSANLLIHVSHIFQEEHVVPIQLIVVGVNHLVVMLKQFVLFFQMLYLSIFFIDLLF
jgi:hypothetical protein